MAAIIDQKPIEILYIKSPQGIASAQETFNALERKLPTIKNRKFYALIFGSPIKEYWACVAKISTDDPVAMDVEESTIPGGPYAQEKLDNWSENIPKFQEIFHQLKTDYIVDESRPSVEFYKSFTEVLLRLPIIAPSPTI